MTGPGGILAESWRKCLCSISFAACRWWRGISSAALDLCVNMWTLPGLRVGHLVPLEVGFETCAVAIRPPASRSPLPSARILSGNAKWLIHSTFLGHLRERLRLPGAWSAERLTLPLRLCLRPSPIQFFEDQKENGGKLRQLTVQFYLFFLIVFFFFSSKPASLRS